MARWSLPAVEHYIGSTRRSESRAWQWRISTERCRICISRWWIPNYRWRIWKLRWGSWDPAGPPNLTPAPITVYTLLLASNFSIVQLTLKMLCCCECSNISRTMLLHPASVKCMQMSILAHSYWVCRFNPLFLCSCSFHLALSAPNFAHMTYWPIPWSTGHIPRFSTVLRVRLPPHLLPVVL